MITVSSNDIINVLEGGVQAHRLGCTMRDTVSIDRLGAPGSSPHCLYILDGDRYLSVDVVVFDMIDLLFT